MRMCSILSIENPIIIVRFVPDPELAVLPITVPLIPELLKDCPLKTASSFR
jgi:hypothetical protein